MITFVNKIIIGLPTIVIFINNAGIPKIIAKGKLTKILTRLIDILFFNMGPSDIYNDFDKH